MNSQKISFTLLCLLVAIGFFGALRVSIDNIIGHACPHIFYLPVCYIVTLAYAFMGASLLINHNGCKHHFFCVGWGVAFAIALLGSAVEFFAGGGICPSTSSGGLRAGSTGGVPLCYISLVLLIIILILFIKGPYKKLCQINE